MYEKIKFNDLFKNKRAAIVCYLSLERKYMDMMKYYRQRDRNSIKESYNEVWD